jgi:hypothetical protein
MYGCQHGHTLTEGYVLEGACNAQRGALMRLQGDDVTPVKAGADHPDAVTPWRSTVGLDATIASIDLERASVYHTIYHSVNENQGIGGSGNLRHPHHGKSPHPVYFTFTRTRQWCRLVTNIRAPTPNRPGHGL